ncbi:MAG: C40 family peptidase [Bacteroidota bacterium]|nr:C40 family peptidase [Bacteroidota bacterium]
MIYNKFFGDRILTVLFILALMTPGCHRNNPRAVNNISESFKDELDSIGIIMVPDLREGIYDVDLRQGSSGLVLKGETDLPAAKAAITGLLKNKGVVYTDSLVVLPDTTIIIKHWGLVSVSVCNIRLFPSYDAEMVSQALMGTPVKILKKEGDWFNVQTPDMYLGWVDTDAIESKTLKEFSRWKASSRLFYIKKTGDIHADQLSARQVSDIIVGCIIELAGESGNLYSVVLPDGRKGFINKGDVIPFEKLSPETYLTAENLRNSAESFMGIPYLWGGTSSKGFDCSGFVKTVYFLNGMILSRDASQQFLHGTRIRRSFYPDSLKTGDLLFFGSSKNGRPRATHVGMYLGNTEFIHCSGMVKINSLDSTRSNFSRFRRNSFLGVRRILGAPAGKGLIPVSEHTWYK